MTLTDFLLARIADDIDTAEHVVEHLGRLPHKPGSISVAGRDIYDLRRVTRECEAKRAIVEVHRPHNHDGGHGDAVFCDECQWDHGDDSPRIDNQPVEGFGTHACRTLTALATVYADHPDYDEKWKP